MNTAFAFIFPGQGSQQQGMLAAYYQDYAIVRNTFQEAKEVLGEDLWEIAQHNSQDKLNQTAFTQPILLAASVAIWRIWQHEQGARPAFLAGHSLGEYSALVCAGAIEYEDALRIVNLRGQLMQAAVPEGVGAMAAIIGLAPEQVEQACQQAAEGEIVAAANFNSPGQIVISGQKTAVQRAGDLAKQQGAKMVVNLPVSVPSHCLLMQPAAEKLAQALANIHFSIPSISVVANVDAKIVKEPENIRKKLIAQLYSPVQWIKTIEFLQAQGIGQVFECGAGNVLAGLNKRISKTMTAVSLNEPQALHNAIRETNSCQLEN